MAPLFDSIENPQLWPLALLCLVPLLLYLLDRRRARHVDWPAVRFFLVRRSSRLRWIKLREALLILTRTLAIAAIVLAFLRPVQTVHVERMGADDDVRRGVVLVVDSSISMGYRHGEPEESSLERARRHARRALEHLRPDDPCVLLTGGADLRPTRQGAATPDQARDDLRETRAGETGFDLLTALDAAHQAASRIHAARIDIVVCTDLQGSAGAARASEASGFLASRWSGLDPRPAVVVVDCGAAEPHNFRVTDLRGDETLVGIDQDTRIFARVVAPSTGETAFGARLVVDDELGPTHELSTATVGPAEDASKPRVFDLEFVHRFERPGEHLVRVELIADERLDPLPIDDVGRTTLTVHDRVQVIIVENPEDGDRNASGRYIELALFPSPARSEPIAVIFRPRRLTKLAADSIDGARVVVLADVSTVSPGEAELIERHVNDGGGLLVFAGDRSDREIFDRLLFRDGDGVLPARLTTRKNLAGESVSPVDVDVSHPGLSIFADRDDGDLRRVEIHRHWQLGELIPETRVLARVDRTTPWIVERSLGSGRAVLVTTSADPEDSSLPVTPLFVPFVHRMVRHLATDPDSRHPAEVVDPGESDLQRLNDATLARLEASLGVIFSKEMPTSIATRSSRPVRIERWPHALGAALLFLVVELILLSRFARDRASWRQEDER